MSIAPDRVEELVVSRQPAGVFHQAPQDRERCRSQENPLVARPTSEAPKTLIDSVLPEWRKLTPS